jgi:hypothetical protein
MLVSAGCWWSEIRECHGRTFKPDGRVRVFLHGRGNSLLHLLLVIVAIDVVALLVDQGRVAVYDCPLVPGMLCDLRPVSRHEKKNRCWRRRRTSL